MHTRGIGRKRESYRDKGDEQNVKTGPRVVNLACNQFQTLERIGIRKGQINTLLKTFFKIGIQVYGKHWNLFLGRGNLHNRALT